MAATRIIYIAIVLVVEVFTACDKAPDGVIKESTMIDLLVDLNKAEGYIDLRASDYPTDSTKQVLKQSIFKKYGITQASYDSSLVWYAHNIETYEKVYKKVILRLQEEQKEILDKRRQAQTALNQLTTAHKTYTSQGDTANLWTGINRWIFTPGMQQGYVKFDFEPSHENEQGDQYTLQLKLLSFNNNFSILLAADYTDGTTSLTHRTSLSNDWFDVHLLTDSMRTVRRVYGYIRYDMRPHSVAFIDSVQLLRTPLDRMEYSRIATQKFISPRKHDSRPGLSPATSHAQAALRQLYTPQAGLNKSGHTPAH